MSDLPFAFAEQLTGPVGGKVEWAIPLGGLPSEGRKGDSLSIKDAVNFWESFQSLGGPDGQSNEKGVEPLSQAATFEQILANWELRGRAGKNTSLEDVLNYAVSRWKRQQCTRARKKPKKARISSAPYPVSKTLREKMKKSNREKRNRQKVNEKFDSLCAAVTNSDETKMEKSMVLSEAIRIITSLRSENAKLEKEKDELLAQCQSVSRCLSAGLAEMSRHKEAALAAAAVAMDKFVKPRYTREMEAKQEKSMKLDNFGSIPHWRTPPPPPPDSHMHPPKIETHTNSRLMKRCSDSFQQQILQRREELGLDSPRLPKPNVEGLDRKGDFDSDHSMGVLNPPERQSSLDAFVAGTSSSIDNYVSGQAPSPMEDIDFTFKPIFDEVISSIPRVVGSRF
mmetsp:Transcript_27755/g.38602  ORF Transcript_27755/g.38602 Transcript_27755/m.38602 type:complete len:396 (-) Transcript_27755:124-1311(-)